MTTPAELPGRLPPPWLVIGVGNPLRGDDGVAWRLLAELEPGVSGLRLERRHQLSPELAADLAAATAVLFIDAWRPSAPPAAAAPAQPNGSAPSRSQPSGAALTPQLLPLRPIPAAAAGGWCLSHGLGAAALLAVSSALYGASPCAHQLLIPAHRCDHSLALSARLQRDLPAARRLLALWLQAVGAERGGEA